MLLELTSPLSNAQTCPIQDTVRCIGYHFSRHGVVSLANTIFQFFNILGWCPRVHQLFKVAPKKMATRFRLLFRSIGLGKYNLNGPWKHERSEVLLYHVGKLSDQGSLEERRRAIEVGHSSRKWGITLHQDDPVGRRGQSKCIIFITNKIEE